MSEVSYPLHDLMRRKLQTALVIACLTLCVASTIFLLLLCARLNMGISSIIENRLTIGFSIALRQLLLFAGALVFIIGVATISFMVFFMMSQRVRDIGLMKAIGCPNGLIFGYLMTELLIVVVAGCVLGALLGLLADAVLVGIMANMLVGADWQPAYTWVALLVVVIFLVFAIVMGAKPILDTTKVSPVNAMSSVCYFGLHEEPKFRVIPRLYLVARVAMRSLSRRKTATLRVFLCLTTVFLLLTVTVAGGLIADQTTKDWIQRAIGKRVLVVGHKEMLRQYSILYSKFYETSVNNQFDYANEEYFMPENLSSRISGISEVSAVERRFVTQALVEEIRSYFIDPETLATIPIGDSRERDSLIIGVEPSRVLGDWFVNGRFLEENDELVAVIGDSLAQTTFSKPLNQSTRILNSALRIVGTCIEPINNGFVVYVPLPTLLNASHISSANVLLAQIDSSANKTAVVASIETQLATFGQAYGVMELDEILEKSTAFVGYLWSAVMLLPLFSFGSASLCMVAYVMLAVAEQRQEFGMLRALGARRFAILSIVAVQNVVVLLSSYVVGVAFGTMTTLMILVPEPSVTGITIALICGWLLAAVFTIFVTSLYPAVKASRASIVSCIS